MGTSVLPHCRRAETPVRPRRPRAEASAQPLNVHVGASVRPQWVMMRIPYTTCILVWNLGSTALSTRGNPVRPRRPRAEASAKPLNVLVETSVRAQ